MQKSVFEGELEPKYLARVEQKVVQLLDRQTDSLRIYLLCAECQARIRIHGLGRVMEDPEVFIV